MTKQHGFSVKTSSGAAAAAAAKAVDPVAESAPTLSVLEREEIARLAFQYWQERGCPEGSPDEDWLRAEADVRKQAGGKES